MTGKHKVINIITILSRLIIGVTFTFSGFVKAVDPLGTAYKIQDYFIALNLPDIISLSLPLSLILCVGEFLLGVFVLLGIFRKPTAILVVIFMAIMTPLTLWIALENPVKDCGCFGDAIIISNWATFYKNIILLICAIFLLIYYKNVISLFKPKTELIAAVFTTIFGISFALYNITYSPVLDFRPFKTGSYLPDKIELKSENADVFKNIFVYEKDGVKKEFTEENYPWSDSTWTFVEMESRLIKKGTKPQIEDFVIESILYDDSLNTFINKDITTSILEDQSYAFWMISYSLNDAETKYLHKFKDIAEFAEKNSYKFYCITSSSTETIEEWERSHKTGFNFNHADERVLKTMTRSNPGLMLVKGGTVINKWSDNKVPEIKKNDNISGESDILKKVGSKGRDAKTIVILALLLIVPLVILKGIEN